jgi:triosephosphate isomerase
MSIFIRKIISDKFGAESLRTRILYGGSVNEKDAGEFLSNGGVDGLLVGRASLDANKFTEIIKICETLNK